MRQVMLAGIHTAAATCCSVALCCPRRRQQVRLEHAPWGRSELAAPGSACLRCGGGLKTAIQSCQQVIQAFLPIQQVLLPRRVRADLQHGGARINDATSSCAAPGTLFRRLGGRGSGRCCQLSMRAFHELAPARLVRCMRCAVPLKLEGPSRGRRGRLHCSQRCESVCHRRLGGSKAHAAAAAACATVAGIPRHRAGQDVAPRGF